MISLIIFHRVLNTLTKVPLPFSLVNDADDILLLIGKNLEHLNMFNWCGWGGLCACVHALLAVWPSDWLEGQCRCLRLVLPCSFANI